MRLIRDHKNSGGVLPGAILVMIIPEITKKMSTPIWPIFANPKGIDPIEPVARNAVPTACI